MARRGWGRRGEWDSYPISRPREAKGGIKARTQRGDFGATWWAKRWVQVLESFHIGARLSRGKSYARKGQVTEIHVGKGVVEASVQGSRPRPYRVSIQVKVLSASDWAAVLAALGAQALYTAKLLAGEMPPDVEEIFTAAGLSLFPSRVSDLETSCSCPDWSNPCKHIAAVFYLLGEEFDRDPFLIFTLRGLSREELMAKLGEVTLAPPREKKTRGRSRGADPAALAEETPCESPPPEPLPTDAAAFWGSSGRAADVVGGFPPTTLSAALPRRLGAFPFWRSSPPLMDTLELLYRAASIAAVDLLATTTAHDPVEDR